MKYVIESNLDDNGGGFRIRALIDIPESNVLKGDLGGTVSTTHNLSQGGLCWIHYDASAVDDSRVLDNAVMYDKSSLSSNAKMHDDTRLHGSSVMKDNAVIFKNRKMFGKASMSGDSFATDDSEMHDNSSMSANSKMWHMSIMTDDSSLCDSAQLFDHSKLIHNSIIKEQGYLKANIILDKANVIDGYSHQT